MYLELFQRKVIQILPKLRSFQNSSIYLHFLPMRFCISTSCNFMRNVWAEFCKRIFGQCFVNEIGLRWPIIIECFQLLSLLRYQLETYRPLPKKEQFFETWSSKSSTKDKETLSLRLKWDEEVPGKTSFILSTCEHKKLAKFQWKLKYIEMNKA